MVNFPIIQFRASLMRSDSELLLYLNNQIQILKSDEVIGGILLNEEIAKEIRKLHKTIPESFFARNIKAVKKLIFFKPATDELETKNLLGKKLFIK